MATHALAFVALACASAHAMTWHVHNPHNVKVTELHLVFSSHFDAGCKTPGCSARLLPGEPDRCAHVGASNGGPTFMGEPFAYHIINRYLDEFIPLAVEYAQEARARNPPLPYSYMTQPWVLDLYLNCEGAGVRAWPGLGASNDTMSLLHCPNATAVAALEAALRRGDIFQHAFPHDGEASYYPDASLFDAALGVARRVARRVGISPPRAVSQRDVPGWTRAALPLLRARNITGLSFGAGTPPGKPDVPPVSVWRDEASGAEVVLTYETAYGSDKQVFVLPNGVALAACWDGDNRGPAPVDFVDSTVSELRKRFGNSASIHASTFEAFFDEAHKPDIKAQLPVVTSEIGDAWLYGVPSDPLKNSQFREATRQRASCIASGHPACNPEDDSSALAAFDRLLVKVPEHTWGVAQGWFLPDYVNYSNAAFDAARAQQALGFVADNAQHADYNSTVNSWVEQRLYVTDAPRLFRDAHPELASNLTRELAALADVRDPSANSSFMSQFEQVPDVSSLFDCGGGVTVGFDTSGAVSHLSTGNGDMQWASTSKPLGRFLYATYNNTDYNVFLHDMASRLGDGGVWPNHTIGKNSCRYDPDAPDDMGCGNFRRPNMTQNSSPLRRNLTPTLSSLWRAQLAPRTGVPQPCDFVIEAEIRDDGTMPQSEAGAPERIVTRITVQPPPNDGGTIAVDWDVVQINKRPTRLPESEFFSFVPAVAPNEPGGGGSAWRVQVLGQDMDPTDVLGMLGRHGDFDTVYGGSPHLHGIEVAKWAGSQGSLAFTSLDVPVVCTGKPTPFVTPRTSPPEMEYGVHFNIVQNIWNTNYVLWYPFLAQDQNIRSRFHLDITPPLAPEFL